jgi:hypothetical protein
VNVDPAVLLGDNLSVVRERQNTQKGDRMTAKQKRTQSIIDTYRGAPAEFGMLKGLLCLPSETCSGMRSQIDTGMIAERMDAINAESLAALRKES